MLESYGKHADKQRYNQCANKSIYIKFQVLFISMLI